MDNPQFIGKKGDTFFAGIHLLIELWEAKYLNDSNKIRSIFIEAIENCNATLLSIDLHTFTPFEGVSGVAVLQESHISIHTWPEHQYGALDIFVCGTIDPYLALSVIKREFEPKLMQITEIKRGIML